MRVNKEGYVERKASAVRVNTRHRANWRDWYLVKSTSTGFGTLYFGRLSFPKEYVGKRIKIKIEVIK